MDPTSRLYVFDDARARAWAPFSLTRPVGELLYGCLLQRERAERFWGATCEGHLAGEGLVGFREPGAPPCLRASDLPGGAPRILVSSRFVSLFPASPDGGGGSPPPESDPPRTLLCEGRVVGWVLGPDDPNPEEEMLLSPDSAPRVGEPVDVEGAVLEWPWHVVESNAERVVRDVAHVHPRAGAYLPPGVERIGKGEIEVGRNSRIERGVVLDLRDGPVVLGDDVRVQAHTRLAGPSYIGTGSTVFGGTLSHVSLGPVCKVRGEVEASILLGFVNKAHDGYLGHAYLGRWVNLGALTTNSDLKNNYGPVRVGGQEGEHETGLIKVGCFLGDHVKTGIGTLLNTGTVLGAGSNVFGGRMPPKYVPPFSWGSGDDWTEYHLDRFLETAAHVMERRDQVLEPEMGDVFRRAFEATRHERS